MAKLIILQPLRAVAELCWAGFHYCRCARFLRRYS